MITDRRKSGPPKKRRPIPARDHALQRLRERTSLPDREITKIRQRLRLGLDLPPGTHHLPLREGYAVIKDVGRRKSHHVLSTVLSSEMRPPGRDLTMYFQKAASFQAAVDETLPSLSDAFRRAYFRTHHVDLGNRVPTSLPRDPKYLFKLQQGERPTTPIKELFYGRKLPWSSKGPEFGW